MSKDIKKVRRKKKKLSGYEKGAKLSENVIKTSRYSKEENLFVHKRTYNSVDSYKVFRRKYNVKKDSSSFYEYTIDPKNRVKYQQHGKEVLVNVVKLYNLIIEEGKWNSIKFNKDKFPMEEHELKRIIDGEQSLWSRLKCSRDGFMFSSNKPNVPHTMVNGITTIKGVEYDGAKEFFIRNNAIKQMRKYVKSKDPKHLKPLDLSESKRVAVTHDVICDYINDKPVKLNNSNSTIVCKGLSYLFDMKFPVRHVHLKCGIKKDSKGVEAGKVNCNDFITAQVTNETSRYTELFYSKYPKKCYEYEKNVWLVTVDIGLQKDKEIVRSMSGKEANDYHRSFKSDTHYTYTKHNKFGKPYFFTQQQMYIMLTLDEIDNGEIKRYTNKLKDLGMKKMSTKNTKSKYTIESVGEIGLPNQMNTKLNLDVNEDGTYYMYGTEHSRGKSNVFLELWKDKNNKTKLGNKTFDVDEEMIKLKYKYENVHRLTDVDIKIISRELEDKDHNEFEGLFITDKGTIINRFNVLRDIEKETSVKGPYGTIVIANTYIYGPALYCRVKRNIRDDAGTICFTGGFKKDYRLGNFKIITKDDVSLVHKDINWTATLVKNSVFNGVENKTYVVGKYVMMDIYEGMLSKHKDIVKTASDRFIIYNRETGEKVEPFDHEINEICEGGQYKYDSNYRERLFIKELGKQVRLIFTTLTLLSQI